MQWRRPSLNRLLKLVVARPLTDLAPPVRELASGLWALDRQVRLPGGARLPSRTTIVRLGSGKLVVISAPPATDASVVASLGKVEHVVAPNTFHYLNAAEFLGRCPGAVLLVAPGLCERVPGLPPAQALGPGPPASWSGVLDLAVLGPVAGASEVVFFHLPTETLIVTDLAFNVTRFPRSFDRVVWRLSGIPKDFGPGRTSRMLLLRDRVEAFRCLRTVWEWPIRRIVVAHGEVVDHDAKERFLKAFADYVASPHVD